MKIRLIEGRWYAKGYVIVDDLGGYSVFDEDEYE